MVRGRKEGGGICANHDLTSFSSTSASTPMCSGTCSGPWFFPGASPGACALPGASPCPANISLFRLGPVLTDLACCMCADC